MRLPCLLLAAALAVPAVATETMPPAAPPKAKSEKALMLGASYTIDLAVAGRGPNRLHRLDRLDLTGALASERFGWSGGRLFVRLLGNSGTRPNEDAGTLQGVDNIEVDKDGLRLFEAWVEQDLGRGSVRLGAYDVNSEFYFTDSSALLLGPSFGIGGELSGTGPRGPAIFPYSALALRGEAKVGRSGLVRAAVVNADAGTLTDRGGLGLGFREGVLGIAEAGSEGPGGKLMVGGWAWSHRHDRLGKEGQARSLGAYVLAERPFGERLTGFARLGISDGRTSSFRGGWQAGFTLAPAPLGGKDSALALGLHQAFLSRGERSAIADDGLPRARSEHGVELTYRERLFGFVAVQPSVQLIRHPGGLAEARPALVGTLRLGWEY